MVTTPLRSLLFILMTLLFVFTLIPSSATAKGWEIKQFEVYPGLPEDLETTYDRLVLGLDDEVPATVITEFERYLHKVAVEYERLGFPSPLLVPIVIRKDGVRAYRVYLGDYPDFEVNLIGGRVKNDKGEVIETAPAKYSVTNKNLRVDLSRAVTNGKIEDKDLEHFTHELFHAVQMRYPLFAENHNLGDWIVEGTAEAIGVDVLYKLEHIQPPLNKPVKRWGGRRYNTALRVADDPKSAVRRNDAYFTSSLWRYIGDAATAQDMSTREKGQTLMISTATPDYSYLDEFFQRSLIGSPSTKSELDWLDKAIEKKFGNSLARFFGTFVPTLVAYGTARVELTISTAEEAAQTWRKSLCGGCEVAQVVE